MKYKVKIPTRPHIKTVKARPKRRTYETRPLQEHEICTRGCKSSVIAFDRGCNRVHQ